MSVSRARSPWCMFVRSGRSMSRSHAGVYCCGLAQRSDEQPCRAPRARARSLALWLRTPIGRITACRPLYSPVPRPRPLSTVAYTCRAPARACSDTAGYALGRRHPPLACEKDRREKVLARDAECHIASEAGGRGERASMKEGVADSRVRTSRKCDSLVAECRA